MTVDSCSDQVPPEIKLLKKKVQQSKFTNSKEEKSTGAD